MQLLKLDTTGEIQIKSEIKHKRFKDGRTLTVTVSTSSLKPSRWTDAA